MTVQSNSPLELVHQFFVKLGARYVVVTDADGYCKYSSATIALLTLRLNVGADEGVIDKKGWLAFLSGLEERT